MERIVAGNRKQDNKLQGTLRQSLCMCQAVCIVEVIFFVDGVIGPAGRKRSKNDEVLTPLRVI